MFIRTKLSKPETSKEEEAQYKYKSRIKNTGALWSVFNKRTLKYHYTYDCRFKQEIIRIQIQEVYKDSPKLKHTTLEYPAYVLAEDSRKAQNLARKVERATKRGHNKGYSEFA